MNHRSAVLLSAFLTAIIWHGGTARSEVDPPVHDCDRLAADPFGPGKIVPGVQWEHLDTANALAACEAAARDFPDVARFQLQYARVLTKAERYNDAESYWRRLADEIHPLAEYNIGFYLAEGKGSFSKNAAEAARWLKKAAERGYAPAQSYLGTMYAQGQGVSQDYSTAMDWLRKAAAQGEFSAQAWLGSIYAQGLGGVGQDQAEAAKWFQEAAEQGYAYAQAWLGAMYAQGQGVPQDYAKAASLLRQAADQGEPTAQNWLGWLYENGHGVAQDHAAAKRWDEKAAAQGLTNAQTALARLGSTGGAAASAGTVEPSASEMSAWHRTAAGCQWWGTAGPGNSDIAWTGQCRDGLVNGEGSFEWRDSTGQHQVGPTLVFYRGLSVQVVRSLSPDVDREQNKECFNRLQHHNAVIEPLHDLFAPHLPYSTSTGTRSYNARFIDHVSIHGYQFKIVVAFPIDQWCSDEFAIVITTDEEMSQDDLLDSTFVKGLFETSFQVGAADFEYWKANGYRYFTSQAPRSIILAGNQGGRLRIMATGQTENIKNYVLEEHRELLAEEERRRKEIAVGNAKTESRRNFDEFGQTNGIGSWPRQDALASNPFQYENQIVGLRASFASMLDRSIALFIGHGGERLAVEGVPSTRFSGGEEVLLAARVKGLKDIDISIGKHRALHLEYVAVHVCSDTRCPELLFWTE